MSLEPPFLVIRPGQSFWVESNDPAECAATLKAFRGGCYSGACCYGETGSLWPIAEAKLLRRPRIVDRILPWVHIPVELCLGPREDVDMRDVVSRLAVVLQSDNEFCEHLRTSPVEILRSFEAARTPGEIIRIAGEHAA